ncbi:MAG TPA: RNA methyltransferase [Anaerolineales bacterium]|nr:RNA methyltransferase [Anaerolineae bacterium]HRJ56872.1 RNA methyltransferase [Anaerolineales bacterium]HRK91185.1 RNA methyltransferase [Anaerolineales bacterium]
MSAFGQIVDITSLQNPRVKHIVKLREDKRQRQKDGVILVEGFDELTLALGCGMLPQTLLSAPEIISQTLSVPHAEHLTVSRAVFEKISYRENPDGWLGIFPTPKTTLEDLQLSASPLIIVAQSIEKPGNLGAILRTADAAKVDALLVCDPRVDLWSPNVIRASRGAVFAVPAVEVDSAHALEWLRSRKMRVLAATPSAEADYTSIPMHGPVAIAVGTEDEGLTDFWMNNADQKVKIPMFGRVNSLNVSIATALMVYEVVRQRNV